MDMNLKQQFLERWEKYTGGAALPITFYYTDQAGQGGSAAPANPTRCVIRQLESARRGKSLCLSLETVRCSGGKRYLGLSPPCGLTSSISCRAASPASWRASATKNPPSSSPSR